MAHGENVAVPVGADLVGISGGPFADHVLNRTFEAGRTGGFEQAL
jgi:hypothetical protein